jgi:hypothetical protein
MIRKILLSAVSIFSISLSQAQICTPDASLMVTGLSPAALPNGQANVNYEQTITVRLFKDTTATLGTATIPVKLDSMLLIGIVGLPTGLSYQCLAPNCRFLPLVNTCVKISGTTSEIDSFPLGIVVRTYGKTSLLPLPPQTDTIRQFSIVVEGSSAVQNIETQVQLFPQPASHSLNITGVPIGSETWVSDMQGKNLKLSAVREGKALILPIENLPAGMYLFHYGNRSAKFIKE